mmetsp:Transcript_26256/g.33440  ORF Transcript_26256/g.33440 Transcript_26256/m.33440 type:complete len:191 (-) Transcript_26256:135-707(-)
MARKKRHSIFPPHPHSLPTPLLFPHTLHPFFKRGRFIRWAEAGFERESIYKRRISIEVHRIVPPYADDDSDDESDDEDGKHDAGRSQKVKPVEEAFLRIMKQMVASSNRKNNPTMHTNTLKERVRSKCVSIKEEETTTAAPSFLRYHEQEKIKVATTSSRTKHSAIFVSTKRFRLGSCFSVPIGPLIFPK